MDIKLLCGIMAGIAVSLGVFILWIKWRSGRIERKGRKGEKIVAGELKRLKSRDTVILNDLLIPVGPGRTSQIDHIVISRRGIFVIETKNIEGRICGTEHPQYWTQHLSAQSRQFYNPLLQNASHIRNLKRLLPAAEDGWWVSVVVFTSAWRLDIRAEDHMQRHWWGNRRIRRTLVPSGRVKGRWWRPWKEVVQDPNNMVLPLEELIEEINRHKKIIPRGKVWEIAKILRDGALSGAANRHAHNDYARASGAGIAERIRQRICPRCGGVLEIRSVEGHEFVGCSNYPRCRFSCSIDRLR